MVAARRGPRRPRGTITELSSGSFRLKVYAGVDPLTGKDHYLQDTAASARDAEEVRTWLLHQVDEPRQSRPKATVGMRSTARDALGSTRLPPVGGANV